MRHSLNRWVASLGVLAMLVALPAAASTRSASFELVLVRDGSAWSATCQAGCSWQTVESRRSRLLGTRVVIDSDGISSVTTPQDTSATFAFRVTADGPTGWKATSLRGTAWTALTFKCAASPCRARITEAGVEGFR